MIKLFAMVAVGGAVGACVRYAVLLLAVALFGAGFPIGTMIVNVAGSFAMGALTELGLDRLPLSDSTRALLFTGLLGGFTTFSTFSADAAGLFERDRLLASAVYILFSVAFSISALLAGSILVRRLQG